MLPVQFIHLTLNLLGQLLLQWHNAIIWIREIMVGIIVIGVIGYFINKGLLWLESKWIPYRETIDQNT